MDQQPASRQTIIGWLAARPKRLIGIALLLPLLYVGSFGPACWLTSRRQARFDCPQAMAAYWPVGRAFRLLQDERQRSHHPAVDLVLRITNGVLTWWITVGLAEGDSAIFRTGPKDGDKMVIESPARYF